MLLVRATRRLSTIPSSISSGVNRELTPPTYHVPQITVRAGPNVPTWGQTRHVPIAGNGEREAPLPDFPRPAQG